MKLTSASFVHDAKIPEDFAFCRYDAQEHVALSRNLNPELTWDEVPQGTRSFVLIFHDTEVPSQGDAVNQEGKTVAYDLPRVDFFHWILVDIPATRRTIRAGEFSNGITPRGKPGPKTTEGMRQGLNNYTQWFESDPNMSGNYFGYDGPCPPWNDERVHRYYFTLYALDLAQVPLTGKFTGPETLKSIEGHVLASARISATYTLNPTLF